MMPKETKLKIIKLAYLGKRTVDIAKELSIPYSTVRMVMRRNGVNHTAKDKRLKKCIYCGKPLDLPVKGSKKIYCSEKCRSAYRRLLGELTEPKYQHVCKHCGKEFETVGNKRQKYCSRECYHQARRTTDG